MSDDDLIQMALRECGRQLLRDSNGPEVAPEAARDTRAKGEQMLALADRLRVPPPDPEWDEVWEPGEEQFTALCHP